MINNKDMVSILIVAYNAEKFILQTVKSCLEQSYKKTEILILDNASGDKTVELLKNFNDQRIKIFEEKTNLGPYAGLNFLMEYARGEYIAIQDHDDIWFPEKIEKQVKFLESSKDFIACGTNTYYYFESENVLILNKKSLETNFVDHTSLIFRNKGFRYNPKQILADELFEKKTLSEKGKIACLQEPLTVHRIKKEGANLSSTRFVISFKNIKEFFEITRFDFTGFLYLFYLCVGKFLPNNLIWIVRKKITLKNAEWIPQDDFQKQFPKILL